MGCGCNKHKCLGGIWWKRYPLYNTMIQYNSVIEILRSKNCIYDDILSWKKNVWWYIQGYVIMKIIIKNKNLSFLKFYLSSSFLAKRWWAKIASHYEKTGRKKIFFLQKIYFLDLFAYLFSVWTGKNKRPEHTLVAHFFLF